VHRQSGIYSILISGLWLGEQFQSSIKLDMLYSKLSYIPHKILDLEEIYLFLLFNDAVSTIGYVALDEMGMCMIMNDE
jgi:hypothetical protein